MNCLCRRVRIQGAEGNDTSVQIIARTDLDRFLGSAAIAEQYDVVLKCSDLDRPPGDTFDNAGPALLAHGNHIPNLKRPVGMKCDARKKVPQRIL